MKKTAIISSPEYPNEVKALMADPIIKAMATGLPAHVDTGAWNFIMAANQEYRRRGGKLATLIGTVAEAIEAVRS